MNSGVIHLRTNSMQTICKIYAADKMSVKPFGLALMVFIENDRQLAEKSMESLAPRIVNFAIQHTQIKILSIYAYPFGENIVYTIDGPNHIHIIEKSGRIICQGEPVEMAIKKIEAL